LAQRPAAHGALLPATRDRGFSRTNAASGGTDQHEQAGFVVCRATIIVS